MLEGNSNCTMYNSAYMYIKLRDLKDRNQDEKGISESVRTVRGLSGLKETLRTLKVLFSFFEWGSPTSGVGAYKSERLLRCTSVGYK